MKTLLLTPPMTQLNTPYPASAYLTGFLREQGYAVAQRDPALELLLELLSPAGLARIRDTVEDHYADFDDDELPDAIYHFLIHFDRLAEITGPVLRFLQGKDPSLALRIAGRQFLPEGPSFERLYQMEEVAGDALTWAFGAIGVQDKAKYLATLFLDDLAAVIGQGVDPHFQITRYGERLAQANPSFDDLAAALEEPEGLIDQVLAQLVACYLDEEAPDLVAISVPFPGNMLAALKIARLCKQLRPGVQVALGGGFVNTELRRLSDPRLFKWVDFVCLDDGERTLKALLEHLCGQRSRAELCRTYVLDAGAVRYVAGDAPNIPHDAVGTPCYDGLPLDRYLSLCEMLNPMHRIWSDGRWNKLTLAHGCYWKKCSFCDVSLDYIGRYETASADLLVDRIEALVAATGQTGFHFVDEAAPPKLLFALAEKLIERGVVISWWGNIRFEKSFTPERCQLLADSGCVAVSGGLEVASDRLLQLMQKGVSVEQVARVTKGFSDAGILVHAYLMYGFPTQTAQETIDALEMVRQLMQAGCIQSGFWHRFALTIHSPIGQNPDAYGIQVIPRPFAGFAENDLDFIDPVGTDHEQLGAGLSRALYNYMHGVGFEQPLSFWFEQRIKPTRVAPDFIARALAPVLARS